MLICWGLFSEADYFEIVPLRKCGSRTMYVSEMVPVCFILCSPVLCAGFFLIMFSVVLLLNISPSVCPAGCHLHSEHAADQRQLSGAGPTRAQQPSAAAARHERLPGASRAHGEALTSQQILHTHTHTHAHTCVIVI